MLKIKNLSKSYDGIKVIDNLSISLFDKEKRIGVFGANGCGKTTLFDCICGLVKYSGEISFNNSILPKDLLSVSKLGVQRTFQRPNVFKSLTIDDHAKISNKQTVEVFKKFLPNVSLNKKAGSLSFGQQKILELALVESQNPKLILFDEPFAGINEKLSKEISKHIFEQEYYAFIIEHDVDTLKSISDKVFEIRQGKIFSHV